MAHQDVRGPVQPMCDMPAKSTSINSPRALWVCSQRQVESSEAGWAMRPIRLPIMAARVMPLMPNSASFLTNRIAPGHRATCSTPTERGWLLRSRYPLHGSRRRDARWPRTWPLAFETCRLLGNGARRSVSRNSAGRPVRSVPGTRQRFLRLQELFEPTAQHRPVFGLDGEVAQDEDGDLAHLAANTLAAHQSIGE